MSADDIRLRLSIRRHGVPEVKLVWPCTTTQDLTIAKLLTQVNEVVPLESGQWGLEDYAVELQDSSGGGFECLHFQPVGKIFKHDDQVVIRSLLTEDLRRRRLSGRHQISVDGKHLVDGLAFGKPWLRAPRDRPTVALPPRKRARLTYEPEDEDDEEEEEEEGEGEEQRLTYLPPPQMLPPSPIRGQVGYGHRNSIVRFRDVPESTSDSEDDNDYKPEEDSESDIILDQSHIDESELEDDESADDVEDSGLTDEVKLLREDNAIIGENQDNEEAGADSTHQAQHEELRVIPFDAGSQALKTAFPLLRPLNVEQTLANSLLDVTEAYAELSKATNPVLTLQEVLYSCANYSAKAGENALAEEEGESEDSDAVPQLKLTVEEPPKTNGKPLIEEVIETEGPSIAGPSSPSAPRRPIIQVIEEGNEADASDSDVTSDSDSSSVVTSSVDSGLDDDDEDFSSGSNDDASASSASDSDDEGEHLQRIAELPSLSDARSQSPSECSVDADQRNGVKLEGNHVEGEGEPRQPDADSSDSSSESSSEDESSDNSSSDDSSDDSSSDSDDSDSVSAPEEKSARQPTTTGFTAPQATDPKAATTPSQGGSPAPIPGKGRTRTQKRNARRRAMKQYQVAQAGNTSLSEVQKALEEQKYELIKAMEAEEVGERAESKVGEPQLEVKPLEEQTRNGKLVDAHPQKSEEEVAEPPGSILGAAETSTSHESTDPKNDSSRPRTKFDVGAGRRLLFGALGLKNPKTKNDEEKIRNDLMKNIRPLQNHRIDDSAQSTEQLSAEENKDFDWQEKITYRAVECCHDNIILSEPPFPFVQRWDPQQQYSLMRKRKRGAQNLHQSGFEEVESWQDDNDDATPRSSSKKAKKTPQSKEQKEPSKAPEELNYDDIPPKPMTATSQFSDMDDLPSLPADVTTLPSLQIEEVKPGMVITWKHWHLPKTSWEPQLIDLTGMVLSIGSDQVLRLILARRNREKDERIYDEETGERIYDKFEGPADSDEEEEAEKEDDGYRDMPWTDLSQPRKVQDPPAEAVKMYVNMQSAHEHGVAGNAPWPWSSLNTTSELKANIEADLEAIKAPTKDSGDSQSIQPGQKTSSIDYSVPSVGLMTESGTGNSANSQDQSWAPNTSSSMPPHNTEASTFRGDDLFPTSGVIPLDDSGIIMEEGGSPNTGGSSFAPDMIVPDTLPSVNISPSSHPNREVDESGSPRDLELRASPQAEGVRSGEAMEADQAGESVVPGTEPGTQFKETTPELQNGNAQEASSSPFPSLEEIWHSANTERHTQSPQKSSQLSVLRSIKGDTGYDEAMKRLDEGEDSDAMMDPNKSIRNLFPNATQPASAGKPKNPTTPVKSKPASEKKKTQSPFKVPEGSQVIELESSPASPRFTEHYADDSLDETYNENDRSSSLPHGPGWITKNKAKKDKKDKKINGRKSMPPSSNVSAFMVHGKGRQKPTRKF